MRTTAALLLTVLAIAATPSHADQTFTGTIRVGAFSPSPARVLYTQSSSNNGVVGYVLSLPTSADGKPYTLRRTSGPSGLEDLDAYFYTSLGSEGGACDSSYDLKETGDTETGSVCPSSAQVARYAIVVIKAGANTTFSLTVG